MQNGALFICLLDEMKLRETERFSKEKDGVVLAYIEW